jgi:hypothetical protein
MAASTPRACPNATKNQPVSRPVRRTPVDLQLTASIACDKDSR